MNISFYPTRIEQFSLTLSLHQTLAQIHNTLSLHPRPSTIPEEHKVFPALTAQIPLTLSLPPRQSTIADE